MTARATRSPSASTAAALIESSFTEPVSVLTPIGMRGLCATMSPGISLYDDSAHRQPVIALWETVFSDESAHNEPALAIDKKLAAQDGLFFVALLDGHVVGTIMAGYDGHRGWLYSVAVHPEHRKRGIGSKLVARAERALTERGCLKINLQILADNAPVAAFYASLGYAVEPRVSMGKRIPQNIATHDG